MIAHCYEVLGQRILPIFYDVDPSEVRKQNNNYEKAFVKHEKNFKENLDLVYTWRQAMTKVANLSGWDVRNKSESKVIDEIVQNAINILGHKLSNLADDLVGIQSRVKALEKLLDLNSDVDDVRVVGITGMGGIGKTTLAAVVYDKISCQFDACSFLMDVSTRSKGDGLLRLQKQFLYDTIKIEKLKIRDPCYGASFISTRLRNLRTLLVLDNVNHLNELENLAKRRDWFGVGSRIIITTRDEHTLQNYGVDDIYRVEQLNDVEALELLCRKSFKHHNCLSGYEELTHRVLEYVKGLPLAAKVLGSSLFNKGVSFWESTLAKLQENPEKEIMDVLRTSFVGLQRLEQEIFLDIACFFHGTSTYDVNRILDCCGFHAESGISNLIDKSLLTIIYKEVHMHDLLQQLGRNIVQEQFPKRPEKWSRLWLYKNFHHVMMERKVTEEVEAIVLNQKEAQEETALRAEALSNFSHLRLLKFHNVNFCGSLRSLSSKLKYLEWHGYPFTYLPSSFQPDELVELIMPNSCIKQLWLGLKPLHNLKSLNLSYSENLTKMPDCRGFPNLERLNLEGCTRLLKLDESIGVLANLTYLNLNYCKSLVSIPHCIFSLGSLETLFLSGCSTLELAEGVDITRQSILSTFRKNFMLPFHFFFGRHKGSVGLSPDCFLTLPYLKELNLSYCNLSEIPDSIACLPCLEYLNLSGNNFITLPSINKLSKLRVLVLKYCMELQSVHELTSCEKFFEALSIFNCPKLAEIEICRSLAFSWLIKWIQEKPIVPSEKFNALIPGNEFPRWLNHQSLGPSIRIQVPPHVRDRDSNLLGIAVCALFVVHDFDISNQKVIYVAYGDTSLPGRVNCGFEELITVGLGHHLWLLYYPREDPAISMFLEKDKFIEFRYNGYEPGLEIKKCGMRWVYKETVERLKQRVMHSGSSMLIDDEDELGIADSFLKDCLHGGNG